MIGALLGARRVSGRRRWLIPRRRAGPIGAGVAVRRDLDFRGGIGEREYTPTLRRVGSSGRLRLGVGGSSWTFAPDWQQHRVVDRSTSLGAGQSNVFVPKRVCVGATTHVGAGESEVAGERTPAPTSNHSSAQAASATCREPGARLEVDMASSSDQQRQRRTSTRRATAPGHCTSTRHRSARRRRGLAPRSEGRPGVARVGGGDRRARRAALGRLGGRDRPLPRLDGGRAYRARSARSSWSADSWAAREAIPSET